MACFGIWASLESLNVMDPVSYFKDGDLPPVYQIETGIALDGQVTQKVADTFAEALELSSDQKEKVQRALNEALENHI